MGHTTVALGRRTSGMLLTVALMPVGFTLPEVRLLLETAFPLAGEDAEALLRVAVKTCLSAGVEMPDLLWRIFEDGERTQAYPLKKLFRALSRFNQFDALARLVDHPSADVRLALVHAWYNYGLPADAARIKRLLSDENPQVRTRAREAVDVILSPVNQPQAREPVDGVLDDQDLIVVRIILGRLDDSDVGPVAKLLNAKSGVMRQLARKALRKKTDWSVAILDMLEEIRASGVVLSQESIAATQDIGDQRAMGLLIRALGPTDHGGQTFAADALVALSSRAAVPLLNAFEHDPYVRRHWGTLVARVAGSAALDPLLSAFESRYASVRQSATGGLEALGTSALPMLLARLPRADRDECAAILGILGRLGLSAALESILARARDTDPFVRVAAICALERFDTPEATRALTSAAVSPHWQIRRAAIQTLGHRRWSNHEVVRALSHALHDSNPRVSSATSHSLARLADGFALEQIEPLVKALGAADERERASAYTALEALRGVIAFSIAQPRLSSPEGEAHRERIERELRGHVDLSGYDEAATRHYERPSPAMAPPRAQSQQSSHPSITDAVRFSVLSPMTVTPGQPCLIDVWAHAGDIDAVLREARYGEARHSLGIRTKGPVDVTRGTTLIAKIIVPSLGWSDDDTVQWTGMSGNATYAFEVPADAAQGGHAGQVQVHVGGIQLARVSFLITVGRGEAAVQDVTVSQRLVSSAFASYASEDRNEVLARIQGMQQVARDLEIFLDVVSLRSGERWEERLESAILERDVLYLFWSRAARASQWVDKEWRTAYRARGLDGIEPVPLEPPDVSPPPPELSGLHFSDWTLQVRRSPAP
jgi:HEAT repeat protein